MSSTFMGDQPGDGMGARTGDTVSVLVACGVRPYREAMEDRLAARPGIQVLAGVGGAGDVL